MAVYSEHRRMCHAFDSQRRSCAASYGSTKRYKSVQRIFEINKRCVVGASGEISDFQQIQKYLEELDLDDYLAGDGISLTPKEVHSYLTRVMYKRRNECGSHAGLTPVSWWQPL